MLEGRYADARSLLSEERLTTRDDWIDYHVIAMSYLRSGDMDEAIRRLTYGLENAPVVEKKFYVTALGLARVKKRQFADALEVLESNVVSLDAFRRQTVTALIGHSKAELGKRVEAAETLATLERSSNPHIVNLSDALSKRYKLGRSAETHISDAELGVLEKKIDEEEFFLAMAA
jgi:tetratricopeptide (TPR) repeat protein